MPRKLRGNLTPMKTTCLTLLLLLLTGCVNQLQTAAERESVNLTKKLAKDYFDGKPIPTQSQQDAVWTAIADIERRLGLQENSTAEVLK